MTLDDLDDELYDDPDDDVPQLVPFTTSFTRPKRPERKLQYHEDKVLSDLCGVKVLPALTVARRLGPTAMARMVREKRIFLMRSAIGAIVQPGYPGHPFPEPFHRSPNALADMLYLRLALEHSWDHGYEPRRQIGRLGSYLEDERSRRHVLFARISGGPLSAAAVSQLLRKWRSDLTVHGARMIIVSTQPELYRRLVGTHRRLEVWPFDPAAEWRGLEWKNGLLCV